MSLQDITILITSFLRPGYLAECLKRVKANLPECRVVVVDDSFNDRWIEASNGVVTMHLPFDSGLPAKRNLGVKLCQTKYMLLGCDDFDFSTKEARDGIERMAIILDTFPEVDVAAGRVHNQPYEGFLTLQPGEYVREHRLVPEGNELFYTVDLTVNYFLARTDRIVPWDARMKIGGEHFDWFWQMKLAGRRTVWVPGVNIETFDVPNGADPRYGEFRARAVNLGHRIMLEKYGIKTYKGFGDA